MKSVVTLNASESQSRDDLVLIGSLKSKDIGESIINLSEECKLKIIKKNEKKFEYFLFLENCESEEIGPSAWKNLQFPISNECKFKKYIQFNECLIWEKNGTFYIFEIVIDDLNQKNMELFFDYLRECVASNYLKASLFNVKTNPFKFQTIQDLNKINDINSYLEQNYPHYKNKQVESSSFSFQPKKLEEVLNMNIATKIFEGKGDFFSYSSDKDEFTQVCKNKCSIAIFLSDASIYQYNLVILNSGLVYSSDIISGNIRHYLKDKEGLFMWITQPDLEESGASKALSFQFDSKEDVIKFRTNLNKALYENSAREKFDKLEEDEKYFIERVDCDDDNTYTNTGDQMEIDFDNEFTESEVEKKNKFINQTYLYDRTFSILDDNTINVYKTNEETNNLDIMMNLPAVKEYEGKDLCLKKGQLFQQETNMLFLDQNNPKSVYQYDIGKSKIVSEWNVDLNGEQVNILGLTPQSKMDQMTSCETVYGFSSNGLFILDSRVNDKNKVGSYKNYKSKINNSCIASNSYGQIVTGSQKGEIRLYESIGKNAKNLLRCYGDPIIAIDVTCDGKYVLATCDRYLMFIETVPKDNPELTGFTTSIKRDNPSPKTLKVKPIDIAKYNLRNATFTPAKFNVGKEREENILTSLGEYIIIWNLNKIKKGILDDYRIKKVNQVILDNQYKYNKTQVVVAMPNTIRVQNQKQII